MSKKKVRIDSTLYKKIKKLSKEEDRDVKMAVNHCIRVYIRQYEDSNGEILFEEEDTRSEADRKDATL